MPFNIWCGHCNQHIGRGVRFNAEKKQVGNFYSTPIWSFRMKCHLCGKWMEIRTDPKNSEYVVAEGARRKTEEGSAESMGLKQPLTAEEALQMQTNPFFRLEHQVMDRRTARAALPKLSTIQEMNEKAWKDDYETSRSVRKRFREQRRQLRDEGRQLQEMKERLSISLPLMPERGEDVAMARNVAREQRQRRAELDLDLAEAAQRIRGDSIFGDKTQNGKKKKRPLLSFPAEEETMVMDDGETASTSAAPLLRTLDFTARRRRDQASSSRPRKSEQ